MKYLVVGLGNIGTEYDATRHNIGFDVADVLVMTHKGNFVQEKLAWRAEIKLKGQSIVVIKPTTYMNLSGKAFKYWMDKEKIPLENVITIVDDLALPLNELRIKPSGSSAGHNGLKDIEATLGHVNYTKFRFGIGSDFGKGQQVSFVLGKWRTNEIEMVKQKIVHTVKAIESFVLAGLTTTMKDYNKKLEKTADL
jgi:peptidyl-tRNA hydrolase, PTH1 family